MRYLVERKKKEKKKPLAADFASSDNPLKLFRLPSTFLSKLNPKWLASPVTTAKFLRGEIGKAFLD